MKEADVAMAKLMAEIQELMDRVKELDKEIQSLETKSKLKKDVAGATLICNKGLFRFIGIGGS